MRYVVADRGTGPYRVLYIAGRPNWEFKFIRRALSVDSEMELVGMIRIAKREAKFTFQDKTVSGSNSLFEGFEEDPEGLTEQADEAVFTRLGVKDPIELKSGFPTTESELFKYQMVVIDDLEAEFFTAAQQQLLRRYVSERGGTLLMLGGNESFRGKRFENSPFAQMLPFYFSGESATVADQRFALTREGWLQPSLRIKDTEVLERERLEKMPMFRASNLAKGVKPGAIVFAEGNSSSGNSNPLLATQRFGQGKTAALLLSDFWRWAMRNTDTTHSRDEADATKSEKTVPNEALVAWRQMFRWLITDVPTRFDVRLLPEDEGNPSTTNSKKLQVLARSEDFQPLDEANVTLEVENPDKTKYDLTPQSSEELAGVFSAETYPSQDGAYLIKATGKDATGESLGQAMTGFVINESADEFVQLQPNIELISKLAESTAAKSCDRKI